MSRSNLTWYSKEPGSPVGKTLEDGVMMIQPMTTVPEVIRLPPDLGGAIVNVTQVDQRTCPDCGNTHDCWHLDAKTDDGGDLAVIECPVFGKYLWVCFREES